MTIRRSLALMAVILCASCGKGPAPTASDELGASAKPDEKGVGTEALEGQTGAPTSKVEPAAGAAPTQVELDQALNRLTQALRKYSFERRRLPKSFDEVVAAGYVDDMPQAPPGRMFAINPATMQVVLVNE